MILTIINNQLSGQSSRGCKILYSDLKCAILIEPQEEVHTFIYQNPEKLCLILGSIKKTDNYSSLDNPAELFIKKYKRDETLFLSHYEGAFLLVEYDINSSKVKITRDTIGLKHGYYTTTKDGFCFSTSINPLLTFRHGEKTVITPESLNLYLTFQYIPQPYTLFSDIYQLPLNGSISYANGKTTVKKRNSSYIQNLVNHTSSDSIDITSLLTDSFKRQLGNNAKHIGAFLSGGMDTSTNIAVLAAELGIKPVTFTASFEEAEYDETPYAKIMAEAYNLEHHIITITSDSIKYLPTIASLYDNPVADRAILPEYIICESAKEMGISYMVTGEGGDEVLGYPRNMVDDTDAIKELTDNNSELAAYYTNISALSNWNLRNQLLSNSNYHLPKDSYLYNLYSAMEKYKPFERIYYGQWQTWMVDNVLMKDTQLFNKFSLQFVSPFMDISVMKHYIALNIEEKIGKLQNKSYLKQKLNKIIPPAIINKPKHKFHVPITEWLQTTMFEETHDMLLSKQSLTSTYMNKDTVEKLLKDHKEKKADNNRILWSLLFLEYWYLAKKNYL